MLEQLTSPSELLIRRSDILLRWNPLTNLETLADGPKDKNSDVEGEEDDRWYDMNVLGQVVNVLREDLNRPPQPPVVNIPSPASQPQQQQQQQQQPQQQQQRPLTSHIVIPAVYKAGISLFVPRSNVECYEELKKYPDLPLS